MELPYLGERFGKGDRMDDLFIALLILFLIVWLFVLPIVLPIVFANKYKRIKQAVLELYKKGEITKKQYIYCVNEQPPYEQKYVRPVASETPSPEKPTETTKDSSKPGAEAAGVHENEVRLIAQTVEVHESDAKQEPKPAESAENEAKSDAKDTENSDNEVKQDVQAAESAESEAKSDAKDTENSDNEIKQEVLAAKPAESEAKSDAEDAETSDNEVKQEVLAAEPTESDAKSDAEDTETSDNEVKQEVLAAEPAESKAKSEDKTIEKPEAAAEPELLAARNALEDKSPVGSPLIPIPVILGLGVVLICTAGAAYISSFWGTASEIVKLIAVGSFSLIFYGAFRLAHNKLQIDNSAKAFYILCIAALGITVTAAELFGLILGNASPAAMMLLPCAVIAAGMFRGYYIFKSRLFPILGISFVFLFLTALSAAIFDHHAMMFFIPAIASTGTLVYATLSKKESATNLRKPAFVLFLVFVCLLMLSTYALDDMLHRNLMAAFALSLAILMHIQLHSGYNRFIECAIPVAMCWAALAFNQSISYESRGAVFFICSVLMCASTIASFISTRKHDRALHPMAIILYAVSICITAMAMDFDDFDGIQKASLFIPALTFILLGAHLMQRARMITISMQKSADADKAAESSEAGRDTLPAKLKSAPVAAAWTALCIGGVYTQIGYLFLADDISKIHCWQLNLGMSAALLAIALIPERFWFGDCCCRRQISFVQMILIAFWQYFTLFHIFSTPVILSNYPFNQLLFLVPALVLTFIERRDALKNNRPNIVLASHISAIALVLWIVPLLMLILDDVLSRCFVMSIALDMSDYILAVDSLLLAGILLYEPKSPLCPKLSPIRLIAGAVLIGVSYLSLSIELENNLSGESTLVKVMPWIAAAIYLAIIHFYTFRKKIALADAPHLRLRGAIALIATMSFIQVGINEQIAAVLLIPALALTFLDDRRSAELKSPNDQTIAAIIGSVLFSCLIALIVFKMRTIFNVDHATEDAVQEIALPAVALLFSIIVLAEHLVMRKREIRPYQLVAAVDLEAAAACALIYMLIDQSTDLPARLMILAAGLIGSWCMSHREHRPYGLFAALAVFGGIYAVLDVGWNHLDTTEPDYFVWIAAAVITAAIAFYDGFKRVGHTHLRAVWALSFVPLMVAYPDPYHIAHLAGVLFVALNLLQYLRDRGQSDHDRTLITVSCGIIAIALSLKIMVLPEDSWLPVMIRPELIALIPLAAAYLVSWRVWKFREPSHLVSSISALVILPLLYLVPNENVQFHAITVTALAIASIIVAFRIRLNRYLTIGIVSIVIIFFSQTKNFWFSLHWWVYLAVVGVVLLTIAVINETERRKGSTLVRRAKDMAARAWKW